MKERWVQVNGFPNYHVSNMGNVKSVITLKDSRRGTNGLLKETYLSFNSIKGYLHVTLCNNDGRKLFRVHRLVAAAFLPNPENKPEVNHKRGVKTDNRSTQLEWSTTSENLIHAYKNKLRFAPKYNGFFDKPVLAIKDTSILEFKSRSDCANSLQIPRGSLGRLVNSNSEYNGYLIYSI